MLFDTLRRKNQAEKEEREWNANRPADYESQNKAAMDAVTGQVGSGFDWDTASKAYQQYRAQATGNAAAAAENAQANAAALAGGYGSSYADSVAKQGQTQALASIDNAVPSLRGQALSEYQNGQNSLLAALSGMANTEALDRSAYGANLANYENWQNFLANQSEQARTENSNYWSNLWNKVKNLGDVAKSAYDGYMGYTYQQQLLEMQKQQQKLQDAQTLNNLFAVNPDMARQIAEEEGYDSSIFDNYSVDGPVTRAEKAKALAEGASLLGNGYVEAAGNYAGLYGLDASQLGDYDTITKRTMQQALQEYAAKQGIAAQYKTTGSSGSKSSRSSSSSGSSGKSSSGWTNSQLRQMASDYKKMKPTDELYNFYRQTLLDNGWIQDDSQTTGKSGNQSVGSKLALNMGSKWGSTGGKTGSSTSKKTLSRVDVAANAAQGQKDKGASDQTIYNSLRLQGYSADEIYEALNRLK